jgi:ceramide glucosyltransferase
MQPASIAFGLCALLLLVNAISLVFAFRRISRRYRLEPPAVAAAVSVVIPLRGIETFTQQTLERAFALSWPDYELLFCVADHEDPVLRPVRDAIRRNPAISARLLIGDDRLSANPKLNNCIKGWRTACNDWVIIADSNVLMPADYIEQMMTAWRADTGLVCSMPLGSHPDGFWAGVECAWLNTFQARWQYAMEALGSGYAQGKSMLWNKPLLDANGGIEALGAEIAEDAASTKLIRGLGLQVHLVDAPFEQPLGRRALTEIWSRQTRWARLRRVTFPLQFAPEVLAGVLPPLGLAVIGAELSQSSTLFAAAAVAAAFYLPEYALARSKNWPRGLGYLLGMVVRDLMLPAVWLRGWFGSRIEWRGNPMVIQPGEQTLEETSA